MTLALGHREIRRARSRKMKWYQLKQEEKRDEFKGDRTNEQMTTEEKSPSREELQECLVRTGEEVLGRTRGGKFREKESWW